MTLAFRIKMSDGQILTEHILVENTNEAEQQIQTELKIENVVSARLYGDRGILVGKFDPSIGWDYKIESIRGELLAVGPSWGMLAGITPAAIYFYLMLSAVLGLALGRLIWG